MNKCLLLSLVLSFGLNALPLFDVYKELEKALPHVALAALPTPVEHAHGLEKALSCGPLFIKRDDLTGSDGFYGGNKVRKLDFLLADALQKGARTILTFGCTGTNHGLATASYCKKLGLGCELMLKHQPNSPVVRNNLLLDRYFGAPIQLFPDNETRSVARDAWLQATENGYFIPTGGSVPLGALGYVNAAFELKQQIQKGEMPQPQYVYIPVGSCGTVAGLLLGCALAQLPVTIVAVAVEPEEEVDEYETNLKKLFGETNELLHAAVPAIPVVPFPHDHLIINKEFVGTEYGVWLRSGEDAARLIKQEEGIALEGTYSAKALAALVADSKSGVLSKEAVVLFWNTYCGLDFSHLTNQVDYKKLNPELHSYFEDAHLVDVGILYPEILLDLKFATDDNFTGTRLYEKNQCLLLKPVAENLAKAAQEFKTLGYRIKVWDGYRPPSVSARLWELMPDDRFIADPKNGGSRHNRGCAVDVTLVDKNGVELDMGTYFCEFSTRAYRTHQELPEHVLKNRALLESIMVKHGFVGLPTEWWHFDYEQWLQYPILHVSLGSE